jgi:PEP-CTERM motif
LFVSIAAQNGGGGTTGDIDVLNAAGDIEAHFLIGNDPTPLDPRGLFFLNDTNVLVANADPGIQLLTPADFAPGSPVPEPSTWAVLLIGLAGLGYAGYRRGRPVTPPSRRRNCPSSDRHPRRRSARLAEMVGN